jgi:dihydroorotase-like cyclic amidohydrolase
MITLKNVKTVSGTVIDHTIESSQSQMIEGYGHLLLLPAFIDPDALKTVDVNAGKTWLEQARGYVSSGITTVFDAHGRPAHEVLEHLNSVQAALRTEKIGLQYHCFCDGNEPAQYDSIGKIKQKVVGIKISVDLDGKPIAAPHLSAIDRIFQIAAQENLVVTAALVQGHADPSEQRKEAYRSMKKLISFAEKYSAELCLQHVRTSDELTLIKEAKDNGILVFAEAAYIHLFVSDKEFKHVDEKDGRVFFLPNKDDQDALWRGVNDGSLDMVGSAGLLSPPQLFMPMMLQAHLQGRLPLSKLIEVARANTESIFRIPHTEDVVLVDLVEEKEPHQELFGKNHPLFLWQGKKLKGWPKYTVASGNVYSD